MKIGLALSGGGIKSLAQLPIIKTMLDENIEIDFISGTSMGSIIAALVASGIDILDIYQIILDVEQELIETKLFIKPSHKLLPFSKDKIKGGYVDGDILEKIMEGILKEYGIHHISDVKIPIAIPAVDLISGKVIVFASHPEIFTAREGWEVISDITLAKAVRASSSFPLVISALELDDYLLADGGIKMNTPAKLVNAYGADKILGITMTTGRGADIEDGLTILSLGNRVYDLMIESYDELLKDQMDLMINVPLGDIWVFEMGKGQEVITEGEKVAEENRVILREFKQTPSLYERLFRKEL